MSYRGSIGFYERSNRKRNMNFNPTRFVDYCRFKNYGNDMNCINSISQKVKDYSVDKYGLPLCFTCQRKVEEFFKTDLEKMIKDYKNER